MFTYTPNWEAVENFFEKLKSHLPARYSGLAGIRLHRTGNPLRLELFGKTLPEKPLYPLALFEIKEGEPTKDWKEIAVAYDVPWVKEADFHRYRNDVMEFYHAEDLLEPRAEEVLKGAKLEEALLGKVLVNHAEALVEA